MNSYRLEVAQNTIELVECRPAITRIAFSNGADFSHGHDGVIDLRRSGSFGSSAWLSAPGVASNVSPRQPRLGRLFAVKRLGFPMENLPLTFEQDLRQISGRAVFASPSNYSAHRYNISGFVQQCCTVWLKMSGTGAMR